MASENCPSCGAPLETRTKSAVLVICPYCDSTLLRKSEALENAGKMAQLQEDGSPLQVGVTGAWRGAGFEVVGRIQLEYDRGFWNEWYLQFLDGRYCWLGEGQGQYVMTEQMPGVAAPDQGALDVSDCLQLDGEMFTVSEVADVRCVSAAGELPSTVQAGYEARVVDLAGRGRRFATIDFSEDPPLVFMGERLEFTELDLKGLREFEGW